MGATISVDKHTSNLDDILQLNPRLLGGTKFEGNSPPEVVQHIKLWKFYEEDERNKTINHIPINLSVIKNNSLEFNDNSCYLALSVASAGTSTKISAINQPIKSTITSAVRSLSPRGLKSSLCQNKRVDREGIMGYQLYIFNGKTASQNLKSHTFIKSFELEKLILSSNLILPIFFGGGVIRGKKLQKGSVIQLHLDNDDLPLSNVRQLIEGIGIFKQIYRNPYQSSISNLLQVIPTPLIQVANPERKVTSPPSLPIASLKIKPPMLNLALKPLQQARYDQIQQQITQGVINFDIRATHRHELKMEHCQNQCSEIVPNLYVSGEKVAKSLDILRKTTSNMQSTVQQIIVKTGLKNKESHICPSSQKMSQTESIECLFYRVIEFIQIALSKKKGVLVHCIQGISRSITMIIAYVIFTMKLDYKKAQAYVKQRRHVASPNNGFMVELIQFYKRLYEDYDSLITPRVFLVSSHCKQTPSYITARLLKHPLFDKKKNIGLDCRGVYIIQTKSKTTIWFGTKCTGKRKEQYQKYAKQYVQILQRYESAPNVLQILNQGMNDQSLYSLWNADLMLGYENNQYTNLFANIEEGGEGLRPGANRKLFSSEIEEEDQEELVKQKLFIYPDHSRGLGVFQKQDLAYISLLVQEKSEEIKIFVWRDRALFLSKEHQDQYIKKVVDTHYKDKDPMVQNEVCNHESDEFIDCFE